MSYTEFKSFIQTLRNYEFLIRIAQSKEPKLRSYYNELKYIIDGLEPKAQQILEVATDNFFNGDFSHITLDNTKLLYSLMFSNESLPADHS